MKAFWKALRAAVGNNGGIFEWSSGKGITILNPTNWDLGTDILDKAKELGLNLRVNRLPQPNPKKPGEYYNPGISVSKRADVDDDRAVEVLS